MGEIIAGVGAFLLLGLSDWALSRGKRALASAAVVPAAVLLCAATVTLFLRGPTMAVPLALKVACGVLALPFLGLLVLSVLIEPGLGGGGTAGHGSLYTRGTYALARHPGVLWFLFLHGFLAVAGASRLLTIAIPFWTGANIALAVVQDRVLFPRVFGPAYLAYRRRVPFLVPTRRSIGFCCSTLAISRRST